MVNKTLFRFDSSYFKIVKAEQESANGSCTTKSPKKLNFNPKSIEWSSWEIPNKPTSFK